MENSSKIKWLWISAVIAAVMLIAILMINRIAAPIIGKKLTAAVSKGSDGAYQLRFESISVNVFSGTIILNGPRLLTDTSMLQNKPIVFKGNARRIEISGIKVFSYWWHKKLEIGSVIVDGASIGLTRQRQRSRSNDTGETLYQKLSGTLRLLSAGKIMLQDTRLDCLDLFGEPARLHLQRLDFEARNLLIDSASERDTSRTLYCKEIIAAVRNFSEASADGAYRFKLGSVEYSTLTKRLSAEGIVLKPSAPQEFFARRRSARFDLALDSLVLQGLNFKSYLNNQLFHAGKISAWRGRLNIFSNTDTATTPGDKVAEFPNYVLRTVKFHVLADTVDISRIDVSYSEFNLKDKKTGTVVFAQTGGRFLNVTNSPEQLKRDAWCMARLSTRFMGSGEIGVQAGFNQLDSACSYRVSGTLKAMPLIAINPLTMPLGQARVKSGQVQSMAFDIRGNRFVNNGILHLLYSDADIEML
ncbi:MAG TPA: hypothetical protein VHS53_05645, partial [Mucilaginibacter sp.]|nr:hypothetical protein [Mucilaginibacter sp.]